MLQFIILPFILFCISGCACLKKIRDAVHVDISFDLQEAPEDGTNSSLHAWSREELSKIFGPRSESKIKLLKEHEDVT